MLTLSGECRLCPRNCGVDRSVKKGYCSVGDKIKLGAATLHFWEEPVLAAKGGSGAVFFSGCPLRCVYCQNFALSRGEGTEITVSRLADIFKELEDKGADNIDLVTGSHFIPGIAEALRIYKPRVPVVFNCAGYESVESLKLLEGLVDIYMPDFKYSYKDIAARYSKAPDYPEAALNALCEMKRQTGETFVADDGLMKRGVLVRHLVLPNAVANSKKVLDILSGVLDKENDYISLMSQYVPFGQAEKYPEINRRLKPIEYKAVVAHAEKLGFKNAFIQLADSADTGYIPDFDGRGVLKRED